MADLGTFLGPSWPIFWPSWAHLGRSGAHIGPTWAPLGRSLGPAWSHLGAPWGRPGPTHAIFKLSWTFRSLHVPVRGQIGTIWDPPGVHFGPILAYLGLCWELPGLQKMVILRGSSSTIAGKALSRRCCYNDFAVRVIFGDLKLILGGLGILGPVVISRLFAASLLHVLSHSTLSALPVPMLRQVYLRG